MYRGEEKGIQITRKPMFMVNTGMRYTLFDNKATLSVNYNDIFDTMKMEFEKIDLLLKTESLIGKVTHGILDFHTVLVEESLEH